MPFISLLVLVLAAVLLPSKIWNTLLIGMGGMILAAYLWARLLSRGLQGSRHLRFGWVSVGDMFDSRFAYGSYAAGDYVTLAMRVDERKVSGAVLKKFAAKEEARIKEEKDLRRLSRTVRLEIKERIKAELMRKSPPVPAVYDFCWNVPKGTVLFFSNGRKPLALLEELFKETFGLSLVMQVPWNSALQLLDEQAAAKLETLQPASLL